MKFKMVVRVLMLLASLGVFGVGVVAPLMAARFHPSIMTGSSFYAPVTGMTLLSLLLGLAPLFPESVRRMLELLGKLFPRPAEVTSTPPPLNPGFQRLEQLFEAAKAECQANCDQEIAALTAALSGPAAARPREPRVVAREAFRSQLARMAQQLCIVGLCLTGIGCVPAGTFAEARDVSFPTRENDALSPPDSAVDQSIAERVRAVFEKSRQPTAAQQARQFYGVMSALSVLAKNGGAEINNQAKLQLVQQRVLKKLGWVEGSSPELTQLVGEVLGTDVQSQVYTDELRAADAARYASLAAGGLLAAQSLADRR